MIVGAGLSGLTAAYVLAKAGLSVIVLERGEYPGAKNLFGGILFSTILNRLMPEFWKEAPVERHIVKRRFAYLTADTEAGFDFRTDKFNQPPYNNTFTVLRAQFDQWLAKKVEEAGAEIYPRVVVDDFIYEEGSSRGEATGRIAGIKARGQTADTYDELRANVVICAEGANSLLAEKSGLRSGKSKMSGLNRAISVKEVISLPPEVINDRFGVFGSEGVAIEYFGAATKDTVGAGFIYTNKDTISVGVGCTIEDLKNLKITLYDMLDDFKEHPCVKNLLKDGKALEYSAHMIPEDNYDELPKLARGGLALVGDAAGLVNSSFYHEITNLAMASGLYAAEAIIEAHEKKDFSEEALSVYRDKLKNSFVLKDMKQFKNFGRFLHRHKKVIDTYPKIFCDSLVDYFTVTETPKAEIKKKLIKQGIKKINILKAAVDLLGAAKNLQ